MDDCPICYEAISADTGHCTLSCSHSFHISCLTRWSVSTASCPMCRNPLGVTEAPAERQPEPPLITDIWMLGDLRRPAPPPDVPPPENRILRIGDGVSVSEGDVALVMQHANVTRGQAVRALRRYEGDIVNSILMLTSPDAVVPMVPVTRDPMVEASDDQATAWFLQLLFEGEEYPWNSYSDMRWRMNNGLRTHKFWVHREFQIEEEGAKLDAGYESA